MGGTSSATGGGSGNTSQVSGYEAEISKQRRQQSNAINTDQKVGTYGDTKISGYKPADYDPEKDDTGVKQSIENSKKKKTPIVTSNNDNGGDYNPTIKEVTETAPTVAEVDQVTTDTTPIETAETTEANRLLKIKKKGRSRSIMTTAKGVTKESSDYTLGVKNLLGRV